MELDVLNEKRGKKRILLNEDQSLLPVHGLVRANERILTRRPASLK
jgi:hypothetical protein